MRVLRPSDIKSGKANELVQTIQEKALPNYEGMTGSAGSMVLIDEENQKGVMLTLWDMKEALEASEKKASHREHLMTIARRRRLVFTK